MTRKLPIFILSLPLLALAIVWIPLGLALDIVAAPIWVTLGLIGMLRGEDGNWSEAWHIADKALAHPEAPKPEAGETP